jgi:diguanylate cyclase (GGDEF)-like protein
VRVAGSVVGVIHATAPIGQPPGDDVLAGLESVAAHLGGRLGMFDALERFEIAATTDPLTGLLNRRGFDERAREALRRQAAAAIVMCDLDQFKRLNDEKGHDAGDRALCLFAEVLRQGLRPSDLVARLGGEEFALVLPGCTADQAGRALARVAQTLAAELEKAAVPPFTASFGVASFPTQGEKLEDLLRLADTALYQSKREGRNRITLCERRSRPPTLTLLKP